MPGNEPVAGHKVTLAINRNGEMFPVHLYFASSGQVCALSCLKYFISLIHLFARRRTAEV